MEMTLKMNSNADIYFDYLRNTTPMNSTPYLNFSILSPTCTGC